MRILHVLDHSIPVHSGYSFRTLSILKHQRELGWETIQLTGPKHPQLAPPRETVDGWEFFRTAQNLPLFDRVPVIGQLTVVGAIAARLNEIASRFSPDILHAHSPVLNALASLRVGARLGIPVVYEIRAFWEDAAASHGTSPSGGLRYRVTRNLETFAVNRAAAIVTICEGLRNDLIARGLTPEKITVVPNAVDVSDFCAGDAVDSELEAELGLSDCVVLGYVGSFYRYEGLHLLIRALPMLHAAIPRLKLLLVGGGPEEKHLKSLAASLDVADRIVFTGRVSHDRVHHYYSLIDLLVYPRLSIRLTETVTPLKPLEAMAQRKIFVASDIGGHRELIQNNETGYLFPPGNSETLAARIIEVLDQRHRWPAVQDKAYNFVKNSRNWSSSISQYSHVYNDVQ